MEQTYIHSSLLFFTYVFIYGPPPICMPEVRGVSSIKELPFPGVQPVLNT